MFTIFGFRIKYSFDSSNEELITYIFCASENRCNYEIHLSRNILELHQVRMFQGFTWVPKSRERSFKIPRITNFSEVSNDVFTFSQSNGMHVNTSLFTKTCRHKEQRPVWIFLGENKYIYELTKNIHLSLYDTNLSESLPDEITSDIVIVGEQQFFSVEEILSHCKGDNEYIFVRFTMYKNNDSTKNIYLFTGSSNMGKSYLSHNTDFSVYETDSSPILPEISNEIVTIGKKYSFDNDSIISKFTGINNYISVDFSH